MSLRIGELPGKISYLAVGQGPPLVVFPGLSRESGPEFSSDSRRAASYRGLARRTGRTVYVVYRPRGIAKGTTMADLATTHAAALSTHFTKPVDVLGISTGGAIALQLAVDYPSALRKLVVACAASWLGESGRRRLRAYGNAIAQGKSGTTILASVLVGPVLRLPMIMALWLLQQRERHIDPGDMLATIDAECGFDVTDRLAEVTAPTLVIAGARDRAFTPDLFKATAAGIAGSRLVLIPNRGHISALWDPRFGQEIAAFLND